MRGINTELTDLHAQFTIFLRNADGSFLRSHYCLITVSEVTQNKMASKYPQRKLGDDHVSAQGLGCMGMSMAYTSNGGYNDEESLRVLTTAADMGITLWVGGDEVDGASIADLTWLRIRQTFMALTPMRNLSENGSRRRVDGRIYSSPPSSATSEVQTDRLKSGVIQRTSKKRAMRVCSVWVSTRSTCTTSIAWMTRCLSKRQSRPWSSSRTKARSATWA